MKYGGAERRGIVKCLDIGTGPGFGGEVLFSSLRG